MRYCITEATAASERLDGEAFAIAAVDVRRLFDDARGCEKFAQRILRFGPGRSRERVDAESDEVLYVLDGTATATIGEGRLPLAPRLGLFVSRGTHWSIEADGGLELVSVLVRDPEPVPEGAHAVVDLGTGERGRATAARQFTLGVTAAVGCASVTQFVGYVPPGRAPDHFHRYDEVLYVLAGRGVLHAGGEQAPFSRGSCIHLPARLVHTLENTGDEELQLLGVFRPAGSPAEAYYPDGTVAAYPEPPA